MINDSKTAMTDFSRGREGILKKEGMGNTLYRWEEKYAAFSYPNLIRRWVFYFRLLRDRKLVQIDQDFLDRSLRAVVEYQTQRWDKILRDHDVNSPVLLDHERKYSMEVFPKLLTEWIDFAEKNLKNIASSSKTIG
jgi:hypothetical protein